MGRTFVFSGTGTRGDLLPMLAMASEMQKRGHSCHVLGNDAVDGLAQQLGVPFTPIAPAQTNNLTSLEQTFDNHVFASYQPTFDFIQAELSRGTDVIIVNPENYAASTLMAERYGLPICRFTLAPYRMYSLEAPYYPLSERLRGPLGHSYRRYTLPRILELRYAQPYVVSRLNEFRVALGLPALSSLRSLDRLVTHQVCLFPEWYCPKASDWPQSLDCVGFPLAPPSGALPEQVRCWLEQRGAPIVFTPGTGVVNVQHFFEVAQGCCQLLQRPGLFLSPNFDASRMAPEAAILHWDYLDLAQVLPHASLLVHHGGIGTTARALEAGIPQVISPQAFDQPDNGQRVARLGAGAMIDRNRLSAEALASAARALLDSERSRQVLADLSRRVRETNAIASLASILERRFLGRDAEASAAPARRVVRPAA